MFSKVAELVIVTLVFGLISYFLLRIIQGGLAEKIADARSESPFLDLGSKKEGAIEQQKLMACVGLVLVLLVYLGLIFKIFHLEPTRPEPIPHVMQH